MDYVTNKSYWIDSAETAPDYPPLAGETLADVVVIGAGITGLTAAWHLKQAGQRVVVLEAGRVGAGTSGATSAHLDGHPDQGARKLINDFGEAPAQAVTAGRMAAIDQIENWCGQFSDDCEFQRVPAFLYSESADGSQELREEGQALARLGLQADFLDDVGLPFYAAGGVRIENQARFHPLRFLRELAKQVHGDDCVIHEHSRAQPPADGAPCTVETAGGKVTAGAVLLCTHSAFLGVSELDLRIAPYQSYVVVARVAESLPDGLFWDDASPYHYLRRARGDDPHLLVVGGADHKTGQGHDERDAMRQLDRYLAERFAKHSIEHAWSAEYFDSSDHLPFIGRVPLKKNLYIGTGYSGTGLTFGTLAGQLLADVVLGRPSPLAEILSPSRVQLLAAARDFVMENTNVAWRFAKDRLEATPVDSLDEIQPGQGCVVRFEGETLAAYRDGSGMLTTLSPTCTHAGCHVRWNEWEKTWDCPCHGGRYSPTGERIYGPPPHDLKQITPDGSNE